MIYLDSAATSMQKPKSVQRAVSYAMSQMASPGRGGHRPAALAAKTVYECREQLAEFFNVPDPSNVALTFNATHSLNIAINSLVTRSTRVLISGYEHNAVTRPLRQLAADVKVVDTPLFDAEAMVKAFECSVERADVVVCTHVSNVFGYILPIEEISKICRENGVPLIIDASQSAGVLDIDMYALGATFVAMPGHKGLFGPQGTGVLLTKGVARPLLVGGTGSDSLSQGMPEILPDMLEAGTHNVPGAAGLCAGLRYVREFGVRKIEKRERELIGLLADKLEKIEGLTLYRSVDNMSQSGVLSVSHESIDCEELGEALGAKGVCVRAGLHCSPLAHKTAGTLSSGTLRLSASPFNTPDEMIRAASVFRNCVQSLK